MPEWTARAVLRSGAESTPECSCTQRNGIPRSSSPAFRCGHDAAPNKQKRERQTEIRQRRDEGHDMQARSTILRANDKRPIGMCWYSIPVASQLHKIYIWAKLNCPEAGGERVFSFWTRMNILGEEEQQRGTLHTVVLFFHTSTFWKITPPCCSLSGIRIVSPKPSIVQRGRKETSVRLNDDIPSKHEQCVWSLLLQKHLCKDVQQF